MINLRKMLKQPWPLSASFCSLCFLSCFWFQVYMAQNATTDPSEVTALFSIFRKWDMQALPIRGGEPCIGFATNGSEFEKPENNPAVSCDCTYNKNTTCHITKLRVHARNKPGVFPEEFVAFRYLAVLKLDKNYFTGPLPAFIGNMSTLMVLSISHNSFSGPIPKELGNLKELTMLSFGSNNFSGTLPPELGNLVKLEQFYMDSCGLGGEIPSTFAKLINMKILDLSYNYFSGSFPPWATTISQLNLVVNNFTFDSSNITLPGLNCLQRNFPCNRNTPLYTNFSIKCGGPQMRGSGGILYEAEDSALGPATFNVTSTKWAVSNAGFSDKKNQSFVKTTRTQVSGADLTPALFKTSRMSTGSLRYYGLGLKNGPYTVTLQFAETVFASRDTQTSQSLGRRVFDIYIQGNLRRKDFDISKEAGGVNRAVPTPFKVDVIENYLDIHLFWAGKGTCCIPEEGDYGPLISAVHAASDTPTTRGKKSRIGLIVGIAVPIGVVILLLLFAVLYMRRKTSAKDDDEDLLGLGPRPNTFSYAELGAATKDFNPSNKLGEGGYGPVYKGTLSDGRVVAVKQLSVASHQGKSQFVTEIATISTVQHRNLVKLYGCCIEGSHRILVYEYLENKRLHQALFGRNDLHLDWPTRFNILLGTARGLAYLHEESKPRIVHRDVKASNILLDAELSPKISDFGWAKERAWTLHENDQSLGLVDPRLTEFDENDATRLIKAALLCTQASPMMKPSMSRVVAILSGDIEASTVMSKPSYLADWDFKDVTTSSFLVDDDTSSTESNVLLNHQSEGSTTGASPRIDPAPSPVNVTGSMLTGIIGEGM
ncbi:probable LRR receptor-like serine/threonine-protein kinase At1g56140 [Prunus avium]|uniref:non-specific serine/threonine protein kinase n=1 Tax=Prunus avium TaxID=42229 RepID=A0A6P5T924_PRUAV|nr:probable LRR receptor-like serine/threonine-protein kinase At1g56140 [Prunus avium]